MNWESIKGEEKRIEIIQLGQDSDSAVTSWERYNPENLTISLGKIAEGINIIINPCTFETFQIKTEIPYQIRHSKQSSEEGVIKAIYATVRNKDFLNRVWVKPEDKEKIQIFSQDFEYTRRPSNSRLPEFDDYIFSSKMLVPSTVYGIFNSQIQAHLEELANEKSAALESDITRCIEFMQREASRL